MFAKSSFVRSDTNSIYSSCNSSDDNDEEQDDEKYYSAKTSFDDFVEGMRYVNMLNTSILLFIYYANIMKNVWP